MTMKRLVLAALAALVFLPVVAQANGNGPLTKRLKNGIDVYDSEDFSASLHARMQLWGGWVGNDSLLSNGSPMDEAGFRIRRARLGLGGRFLHDFSYKLELELFDAEKDAGPLYKAWVDYSPTHYFGIRFGADKFLLMKSDIVSSAMLPHLDRPMGTLMMSPSNTLGVVLYSEPWEDHLRLSVGLFNGLRRHSSSLHDGYAGVGMSLGNQFDGLAVAGRIDFEPLAPLGQTIADTCGCKKFRLGLGVGGHMSGGDRPVIGGGNLAISAFSAYLHVKTSGFHLFGEFAQEWVTPQPGPTTPVSDNEIDSSRYVANLSIGYVFLPRTLGLAVRGELIEPHTGTDDHLDEWAVAATLNYYIVGDYLKAQLEYQHRASLNGNDPQNDSVLGAVQVNF
jgi:hypothetical protein